MIGIVVGLRAEARVAAGLGGRVSVGGGDAAGAERAARSLAQAGATALLSFGLAGGLVDGLAPGAIVVPQMVRCGISGERWLTDPALAQRLGEPRGQVFCGRDVVTTAQDKRALGAETGAAAVDLESSAVAHVATEFRLPFAVLRAICDPVGRDLPPAAIVALNATGRIQPLAILVSLVRKPSQLPSLFGLAREAALARRSLRRRVAAIGPLE